MNKKFKNQTLTKGELCAFFEKKNQFALMCELVDVIETAGKPAASFVYLGMNIVAFIFQISGVRDALPLQRLCILSRSYLHLQGTAW